MCRVLERRGWVRVRTGRHHVYRGPGGPGRTEVPNHPSKLLPTGTQRRIMRDAGLTEADL
jgi:predicted RNA binding protein YcfA (HicA-like mRNA interferase family)